MFLSYSFHCCFDPDQEGISESTTPASPTSPPATSAPTLREYLHAKEFLKNRFASGDLDVPLAVRLGRYNQMKIAIIMFLLKLFISDIIADLKYIS